MINFVSNAWLSVFPPAFKEGTYEVDQAMLDARVRQVAHYAIAYLITAFVIVGITACLLNSRLFTIAAYGMPLSILPMIFFPLIDSAVAERTADTAAVHEYLTADKPSAPALRRIQSHIRAAEMYVARGGDLNKRGGYNAHLLAYVLNNECPFHDRFKVFKLFVDKGVNIHSPITLFNSLFELAVSNREPIFLEYLVKKKKVKKENVEADQFQLWLNIGNAKNALLLKELGLDVSVQKDGKTVFTTLAESAVVRPMSKLDHLQALKACLPTN